jgi:hypothetical protein
VSSAISCCSPDTSMSDALSVFPSGEMSRSKMSRP